MDSVTNIITAEQIAETQLLAAVKLWHEGNFVSSITLAGAAEEILGKRLRRLGKEPVFDNMKRAILQVAKKMGDNDPKSEKAIANLMNQTKNELKHYSGDEALEFDLRADAVEMIERAIGNYSMLMDVLPDEMMEFWSAVEV